MLFRSGHGASIPVPSIAVVVPVYRGEATLRELHRRLVAVLAPIAPGLELIFVDDRSPDGSWAVIGELAAADPRVRGIRLGRNYGQHNALLCGIRAARSEIVVTLDDDLQNPPEEIPRLLAALADGADVVYGSPAQERHGFWRDQASRLTKIALQGAMGAETARHVSAFRAFRTDLRDAFGAFRGPLVSIDVLLTWGTTRFAHVTVRHDPRAAGVSGYTLRRLITHALNMITGFTTIPLQLASLLGLVFAGIGLVLLLYVIATFIVAGGIVPGFPFLASAIAIFSGVQLFALGIIGEYVARIHLRTMDRPSYLARETTAEPETTAETTPEPAAAAHPVGAARTRSRTARTDDRP